MLTKNPPWVEFEAMAAIFKIATCKEPNYTLPAEVSPTCRDFLKLCFRKKTSERPSARDLLEGHRFLRDT